MFAILFGMGQRFEDDVARLDIPMNDPPLVGIAQCFGDLRPNLQRLGERQEFLEPGEALDVGAQIAAHDVLHRDV